MRQYEPDTESTSWKFFTDAFWTRPPKLSTNAFDATVIHQNTNTNQRESLREQEKERERERQRQRIEPAYFHSTVVVCSQIQVNLQWYSAPDVQSLTHHLFLDISWQSGHLFISISISGKKIHEQQRQYFSFLKKRERKKNTPRWTDKSQDQENNSWSHFHPRVELRLMSSGVQLLPPDEIARI